MIVNLKWCQNAHSKVVFMAQEVNVKNSSFYVLQKGIATLVGAIFIDSCIDR